MVVVSTWSRSRTRASSPSAATQRLGGLGHAGHFGLADLEGGGARGPAGGGPFGRHPGRHGSPVLADAGTRSASIPVQQRRRPAPGVVALGGPSASESAAADPLELVPFPLAARRRGAGRGGPLPRVEGVGVRPRRPPGDTDLVGGGPEWRRSPRRVPVRTLSAAGLGGLGAGELASQPAAGSWRPPSSRPAGRQPGRC